MPIISAGDRVRFAREVYEDQLFDDADRARPGRVGVVLRVEDAKVGEGQVAIVQWDDETAPKSYGTDFLEAAE